MDDDRTVGDQRDTGDETDARPREGYGDELAREYGYAREPDPPAYIPHRHRKVQDGVVLK